MWAASPAHTTHSKGYIFKSCGFGEGGRDRGRGVGWNKETIPLFFFHLVFTGNANFSSHPRQQTDQDTVPPSKKFRKSKIGRDFFEEEGGGGGGRGGRGRRRRPSLLILIRATAEMTLAW